MPELRLVHCEPAADRCRTVGCSLVATAGDLLCAPCQEVHRCAQELRERLLARHSARLRLRHRSTLDELSEPVRERLLAHMAARAAHDPGDPAIAGLEDFLSELHELGLAIGAPA